MSGVYEKPAGRLGGLAQVLKSSFTSPASIAGLFQSMRPEALAWD